MDLAIVAGRVSTKDQADKGYSLPEQVATGLAYVAERGYQLADVPGFSNAGTLPAQPGVFVEDFTGMSMDRPALDAVREVVKQHGVKVIIYTETDRLARKRIYGDLLELEFEELGARVEYAIERFDDSDEGKLFKDVKKALGEYERVKILRRMRTGKVGRAKAGKVLLGDCAPYGYRKSADGTTLVIDADEAKIVRRIFRAYIEGLSPYAIAGRLHADHVPTYAGPAHHMNRRGWSESMIRTVLANETYSGIWHHNKTRNEHKDGKRIKRSVRPRVEWIGVAVPAIIDAETFAQARARAAHNKANARRNRKHTYLFSGMLVCAACGRCYSGTTTRGKWRSYNCNGRLGRGRHGDRQCTAPYYSEADLDAAVWPWLTGILSEPEQALQRAWDQTWQRFAAEVAARSTAIDRLVRVDTQLADVRRRLVNLDDQLEVETDQESRSALRERKAQRVVLRRELEAERANLEAQIARQPPAPGDAQGLIAMCNAILHEAEPETPEKKRERYERVRMRARLEVKDGLKLAQSPVSWEKRRSKWDRIVNGTF